MIVPTLHTPLPRPDMRDALVAGHRFAFGREVTPQALAVALAQLAVEHGADGHAVYCDCIGNTDAGRDWQGDVFALKAREVIDGATVERTKLLRAYDNAAHGGQGYWLFLAMHDAEPLRYFEAGDPAGAALALRRAHYFTGNPAAYEADMVAVYREVYRPATTPPPA